MAAAAQFRTEHVQQAPRGWRTRTIVPGPGSQHEVRIAFPPGPRRKGSGRVVEILHPADERNPKCAISQKAKSNPGELLIFGNPSKFPARLLWDTGTHKGGARVFSDAEAKKMQRIVQQQYGPSVKIKFTVKPEKNPSTLERKRAARDRAGRIRAARLNPKRKNAGTANHKPSCKCFACKYERSGKHATNPKRSTKRRRRGDRNPDETKQAVALYQSFHGKDPQGIVEKHVSAAVRLDYTALGDLEYIRVAPPAGGKDAVFNFEGDGVKLASSPDGKQLYCIGGNQNLLSLIDKESAEKDFIDLGDAIEVQYLARKIHGQFRPVSYFHKFGEVDGSLPRLAFDRLKKQVFFIGGNYGIDTSKGVSPGIEN